MLWMQVAIIAMNIISCKIAIGSSGTTDGTPKPNHPNYKSDCPNGPICPD